MKSEFLCHPGHDPREFDPREQRKQLRACFDRAAASFRRIGAAAEGATVAFTCLSCGAQGAKDQQLPCGH